MFDKEGRAVRDTVFNYTHPKTRLTKFGKEWSSGNVVSAEMLKVDIYIFILKVAISEG